MATLVTLVEAGRIQATPEIVDDRVATTTAVSPPTEAVITPIAHSLASFRPAALDIPERQGRVYNPVETRFYNEAQPRGDGLTDAEVNPSCKPVVMPKTINHPPLLANMKAAVKAAAAASLTTEKRTLTALLTLQIMVAFALIGASGYGYYAGTNPLAEICLFVLTGLTLIIAGIVLNFGLKGIDEPVEAAYQQRHMLMGREETHVFTTFQIAFIGVFLMFLFSGGTASVTPLMCKRGSVSLVFRALHSCGTPVVVQAACLGVLSFATAVGAVVGLCACYKYNQRTKHTVHSRMLLASSQKQLDLSLPAEETYDPVIALVETCTDDVRQSSVIVAASALICVISLVGNMALSFYFPTKHEKTVIQLSAVQNLAMTVLVFTSSCVRKPLLYAVAYVFSVWSVIALVSAITLIAKFIHGDSVACSVAVLPANDSSCHHDELASGLYYGFTCLGIVATAFTACTCMKLLMQSSALEVLQNEIKPESSGDDVRELKAKAPVPRNKTGSAVRTSFSAKVQPQ